VSLMPRPTAPMVGPGGLPTREWLDYLRGLAGAGDLTGIARAIERLQRQVAELEAAPPTAAQILGLAGIRVQGLLADGLVRIGIEESGVTPGTYTNAELTIGADGRVTDAQPAPTGDLIPGPGVTLTGDLAGRLVGAGDVQISASAPPAATGGEILVADGISPPVMLTDEGETDFLYQG